MKKNMGSVDIGIRIVIAVILAILYFANIVTGTLGIVLLVIGAVLIVTSIFNFCPLYATFGISTCSVEKNKGT